MKVELLVVESCPHTQAATRLLRSALDDVGLADSGITTTVIRTTAEAEARHFTGSPSIFIDGADLLPQSTAVQAGLSCRLNRHPDGSHSGLPHLSNLTRSLKSAARRDSLQLPEWSARR